jgi:hypothetical protein
MGTSSQTPIQIFRRGRQVASDGTAREFTDADLAATAAGYDPGLHQAPIVVGHPTTDAPAYGWVAGLAYSQPEGILDATPDQVDAQFADLVREGRLKYVSASFWTPAAPTNPKPGIFYLRHVGFLGAQPPSVKGLRPAEFSDADPADTLTLTFVEHDPTEDPSMSETVAEIAAREAELDKRAQELATREQAVHEREAAAAAQAAAIHHTECAAFCEGLVAQGRLLPLDKAPLATLLASLPTQPEAASLDYAEAPGPAGTGDSQARTPAEYLRALLARLPVQVDYSERSAPGAGTLDHADPAAADKAKWERDPKLRAEFSSAETYVAFAKAQAAGRVSFSNRLTTED